MPPPELQRWAIMAGIPEVLVDEAVKRISPPGTDFAVAHNEPPRASVVTIPLRVTLPTSLLTYPYIAAAHCSGLLLLCGTHLIDPFSALVSYHLCHARTGKIVSIIPHNHPTGFHGATVGLLTKGDACVVAELQPDLDCTGRATLLTYKVGEGACKWSVRELAFSPPPKRPWFGEGVVSHDGRLWWVDLSYGLLSYDPFADNERLLYVPLPQVADEIPADPVRRGLHRCVKVSRGRLRYVQIHGKPDAPVVSTWALVDPFSKDWIPERRMDMADVWFDESYLGTMLPWSVPDLALIHPTDPDRVYFFLGSCIFAVDLRRKMVVGYDNDFQMPDPPRHLKRSSHFVHAWCYDPSSSIS
ncbi:hypothetical protein ACP70R_024127 [Stipagrostis hirtigluma subsp. patula]